MDDTQQQVTQPTATAPQSSAMPTMGDLAGMPTSAPTMPAGMVPGGDLTVPAAAGMTPPPAPEPSAMPSPNPMPEPPMPAVQAPTMPMPSEPSVPPMPAPTEPAMAAMPTNSVAEPVPAHEPAAPAGHADDYSYAEDILSEILDSLDRIEAKLEALEKKQG